MSLVTIELKRLRYCFGNMLINTIMTVMFVLNAKQFLNVELITFLWVILPFVALAINRAYHEYMDTDWLMFILDTNVYNDVFKIGFMLLSILQNLPIAVACMVVVSGTFYQGVMYWFVLDIIGYLLFCVRIISYQSSGVLLSYIFMIPLVYPWIILGVMASLMHTAAIKFIIAIWLIKHAVGSYFFTLCCKVGQVAE